MNSTCTLHTTVSMLCACRTSWRIRTISMMPYRILYNAVLNVKCTINSRCSYFQFQPCLGEATNRGRPLFKGGFCFGLISHVLPSIKVVAKDWFMRAAPASLMPPSQGCLLSWICPKQANAIMTTPTYCIARNFCLEKTCTFFIPCHHGRNYYPANFLSCVNDYIKPT